MLSSAPREGAPLDRNGRAHRAVSYTHLDVYKRQTSGITLEFIGCIVFAVVLVLYFLMMRRAEDGMAPKWCGVLAIVVGLALPVITGMSYLMASLPSWNTPLLPVYYLANTVFMGGLTALVIAGLTNDDSAKDLGVKVALAGGALQLIAVFTYASVSYTHLSSSPPASQESRGSRSLIWR